MNSPLSSTCRRRRALRAALVTLIAFTGCQGSLRSWRRDDPSLHDLVVTPHPWDEPARRDAGRDPAQNAARDAANRDLLAKRNRMPATKHGRANPYAANLHDERDYGPANSAADEAAYEDETFEIDDAELRALMSQVDPAYRTALIQYYKLAKAQREAELAEQEEELAPQPRQARASHQDRRTPSSRRSIHDGNATVFHMRDDEEDDSVQLASATGPSRREEVDALGNRPADRGAHFTLRDDDLADDSAEHDIDDRALYAQDDRRGSRLDNPAHDGSNKALARHKPQDIQPPKGRPASRSVEEPMADTGLANPIASIAQRGTRDDANTVSHRKNAQRQADQNRDVDAHFTDNSRVVLASAESSVDAHPSVAPATLRPSQRDNARNLDSAEHARISDNDGDNPTANVDPTDADYRDLAHEMLRSLDRQKVDSSASAQLNHHVTKRLLHLILGQLNQALEPIPGLQPSEQEYYRHTFQAIYNSIDPRGNPVLAKRWPLVLDDHRTAGAHLGASSNLEVKNAAFCSNVDGFGVITKFPSNKFRPNQEVLLYCEVDNFVSEPIKNGYETKLRGTYDIVDGSRKRIEEVLLPEEVDICRSPRRDYFFVYRIYTPKNIAPGRYQLQLTIEDVKGNKFGQTVLDLEIGQ